MKTILLVSGIIVLILGLVIRSIKNKYEFNNITDGGVVKFKSYWRTVTHKLAKGIADILMIGGVLVILYSFIYDPYSGEYPANWRSLTSREKQLWKYYHDHPEQRERKIKESTIRPYELLKGKEFDDWAKQLEVETGISHVAWRDIADETEKDLSMEEQEKLMKKWYFTRAMVRSVKNEYEPDLNNPRIRAWEELKRRREKGKLNIIKQQD